MSTELSTIKFLDSAKAIAVAYPTFTEQFRYKLLLDMAKVIGERTPARNRAHIESQVALAASVDKAMASGEVTSKVKGTYQVGKSTIPGCLLYTSPSPRD